MEMSDNGLRIFGKVEYCGIILLLHITPDSDIGPHKFTSQDLYNAYRSYLSGLNGLVFAEGLFPDILTDNKIDAITEGPDGLYKLFPSRYKGRDIPMEERIVFYPLKNSNK
jgi:hypothetical protein